VESSCLCAFGIGHGLQVIVYHTRIVSDFGEVDFGFVRESVSVLGPRRLGLGHGSWLGLEFTIPGLFRILSK